MVTDKLIIFPLAFIFLSIVSLLFIVNDSSDSLGFDQVEDIEGSLNVLVIEDLSSPIFDPYSTEELEITAKVTNVDDNYLNYKLAVTTTSNVFLDYSLVDAYIEQTQDFAECSVLETNVSTLIENQGNISGEQSLSWAVVDKTSSSDLNDINISLSLASEDLLSCFQSAEYEDQVINHGVYGIKISLIDDITYSFRKTTLSSSSTIVLIQNGSYANDQVQIDVSVLVSDQIVYEPDSSGSVYGISAGTLTNLISNYNQDELENKNAIADSSAELLSLPGISYAVGAEFFSDNKLSSAQARSKQELLSSEVDLVVLPDYAADLSLLVAADSPLLDLAKDSLEVEIYDYYSVEDNLISAFDQSKGESISSDTIGQPTNDSEKDSEIFPRKANIVRDYIVSSTDYFGSQVFSLGENQVYILPAAAQLDDNSYYPAFCVDYQGQFLGVDCLSEQLENQYLVLSTWTRAYDLLKTDTTDEGDLLLTCQKLRTLAYFSAQDYSNLSSKSGIFFLNLVDSSLTIGNSDEKLAALLDNPWVSGIGISELIGKHSVADTSHLDDQYQGKSLGLQEKKDVSDYWIIYSNQYNKSLDLASILIKAQDDTTESITDNEQNTPLTSDEQSRLLDNTKELLNLISLAPVSLYCDEQKREEVANTAASLFTSFTNSIRSENTSINLIYSKVNVPFTVTNDSNLKVEVTVQLISVDARVQAEQIITSALSSNSTTIVEIPVLAVGSGTLEARLIIRTLDDTVLYISNDFTIYSHPNLENRVITFFGAILVVVFLLRIFKAAKRKIKRIK